ncbi:MAG: hypothetical protein O7E55_08070 [Chloroflexi bacterium]|nr:hypothetical protein [Chloroflexota bacterium]
MAAAMSVGLWAVAATPREFNTGDHSVRSIQGAHRFAAIGARLKRSHHWTLSPCAAATQPLYRHYI